MNNERKLNFIKYKNKTISSLSNNVCLKYNSDFPNVPLTSCSGEPYEMNLMCMSERYDNMINNCRRYHTFDSIGDVKSL